MCLWSCPPSRWTKHVFIAWARLGKFSLGIHYFRSHPGTGADLQIWKHKEAASSATEQKEKLYCTSIDKYELLVFVSKIDLAKPVGGVWGDRAKAIKYDIPRNLMKGLQGHRDSTLDRSSIPSSLVHQGCIESRHLPPKFKVNSNLVLPSSDLYHWQLSQRELLLG